MNAIEIRNLTKNFGAKQAVNGLNMTVPEGAIYGFIGENGSGKSTTEKIICGLIHESGGTVKLYGRISTLLLKALEKLFWKIRDVGIKNFNFFEKWYKNREIQV